MPTLIVYYSHSGNNALLAQELAKQISCDIVALEETSRRTGLTIFLDIFLKRTPKIKTLSKNPALYDSVILIAPLWAGKIASPLKAFLKMRGPELKKFFFITFSGGNPKVKDQLAPVTADIKALTGKSPDALFELDVGDLFPPEKRSDPRVISNYKLTPEDLLKYQSKIAAIIAQLSSSM